MKTVELGEKEMMYFSIRYFPVSGLISATNGSVLNGLSATIKTSLQGSSFASTGFISSLYSSLERISALSLRFGSLRHSRYSSTFRLKSSERTCWVIPKKSELETTQMHSDCSRAEY